MFISYIPQYEGFIIHDTTFIENYSRDITGIGWARFAIVVADIYSRKNLPIAKNIALMLKTYPLSNGYDLSLKDDIVQIFNKHNKYKYLLPCLLRELNA